ncbi:MAG: helix-turn-helix domain-containing protein [Bacteroidales bacterium]
MIVTVSPNTELIIGNTNMVSYLNKVVDVGFTTLFICMEGEAEILLYGKKHLFRKGDILTCYWDMQLKLNWVSEHFSTFFCRMNEAFCYEVFQNMSANFCEFSYEYPIIPSKPEYKELLSDWVKQVNWVWNRYDITKSLNILKNNIENLFRVIDIEIQRFLEVTALPVMPRAREILREFGILIERYATEQHNVAFYADKLNITAYYLSTITAEIMKETPKSLIDKKIIMEMKLYLRNTGDSLKMIAEKMSFDDISYMCRFFKRHTGMTMLQYRKESKF